MRAAEGSGVLSFNCVVSEPRDEMMTSTPLSPLQLERGPPSRSFCDAPHAAVILVTQGKHDPNHTQLAQ